MYLSTYPLSCSDPAFSFIHSFHVWKDLTLYPLKRLILSLNKSDSSNVQICTYKSTISNTSNLIYVSTIPSLSIYFSCFWLLFDIKLFFKKIRLTFLINSINFLSYWNLLINTCFNWKSFKAKNLINNDSNFVF